MAQGMGDEHAGLELVNRPETVLENPREEVYLQGVLVLVRQFVRHDSAALNVNTDIAC